MNFFRGLFCLLMAGILLGMAVPGIAQTQQELQVNTPAISAIRDAMRARFRQIEPFINSGAVGITFDGRMEVRDANLIPLAQRATVNGLVAAQNQDTSSLYREIAVANGKPEWENDIRKTFGQRWIGKAKSGWYVKGENGQWTQK